MRLTITIAGIDHSDESQIKGFKLVKATNGDIPTCQLILLRSPTDTNAPEIMDEVIVTNDDSSERHFGGFIINISPEIIVFAGTPKTKYELECVGYEYLLANTYVASEDYAAQADDAVIADLFSSYLPEISTTNVDNIDTVTLEITRMSLLAIMKRITGLTGGRWYIDPSKNLYYYDPANAPKAPFVLREDPTVDFDDDEAGLDSHWNKWRVTYTPATAKVAETADDNSHYMADTQTEDLTIGNEYTYWFDAKAGERNWIRWQTDMPAATPGGSWHNGWIDLSNGIIEGVPGGFTIDVVYQGDDIYRIFVRATAGQTSAQFHIVLSSGRPTISYPGTEGHGIYLYRVVLEDGKSFERKNFKHSEEWKTPVNQCTVVGGLTDDESAIVQTFNDTDSQTLYGRTFARTIVDRKILRDSEALLRATIEVEKFGNPEKSGSVVFQHDGVQVGDLLQIESAGRNVSDSYIVNKLTLSQPSPTITQYMVGFGRWSPDLYRMIRELADEAAEGAETPVAKPSTDSVGTPQVQALAITDSEINDVEFAKVANVSITDSEMNDVAWGKVTGVSIVDSDINDVHWNTVTNVSIVNADINDVDFGKVTNVDIVDSDIHALTITQASIANLTITGGKIANLTITDAQIGSLSADKINAGKLSVDFIDSWTGATITVGAGVTFDGSVTVNNVLSALISITTAALTVNTGIGTAISGNTGSLIMATGQFVGAGGVNCAGSISTNSFVDAGTTIKVDGSEVISASKQFTGSGGVSTSGAINTTNVFKKSGTQVVGARGGAISSVGVPHATTTFGEVNTALDALAVALNLVLARLRGHGLIAT